MRNTVRSGHQSVAAFSLKATSAAILSALLFSHASAAGLGKLTVLSTLGQPLHAEIELIAVSEEEVQTLIPKLASAESFRQANLPLDAALLSLRFAIESRNGKHFVRITSSQIRNEPFLDLLLELSGKEVRLIREYTILLDPVDILYPSQSAEAKPNTGVSTAIKITQPEQIIPTNKSEQLATNKKAGRTSVIEPHQQQAIQTMTNATPHTTKTEKYVVKSGESLVSIANKVKPKDMPLEQMLNSLYKANRTAFIANDINRLRAGWTLVIPLHDQMSDAQIEDSSSLKSNTSKQSGSKGMRGKIDWETSPGNSIEKKSKLKLLNPLPDDYIQKSNAIVTNKDSGLSAKMNENKGVQLSEIESNVNELKKLLIQANNNLINLQTQLTNSKGSPSLGASSSPNAVASQVTAKPGTGDQHIAELQKTLEIANRNMANLQNQVELAKNGASPAIAPGSANSPAVAQPSTLQTAPTAPIPKPAIAPPPKVASVKSPTKSVTPPPPEPGFIESLMNQSLLIPISGALITLLTAIGLYARHKKNNTDNTSRLVQFKKGKSALPVSENTGMASIPDTQINHSVFNSNIEPSVSQLDTSEVDLLTEANMYLAHGRTSQAEKILKEACLAQPERIDVRIKLLEISASQMDMAAFETLANELFTLTQGVGAEWQQVRERGLLIDPNNPLFSQQQPNEVDHIPPQEQSTRVQDERHVSPEPEAELMVFEENNDSPHQTSKGNLISFTSSNEAPILEINEPPLIQDLEFDLDIVEKKEQPLIQDPKLDLDNIETKAAEQTITLDDLELSLPPSASHSSAPTGQEGVSPTHALTGIELPLLPDDLAVPEIMQPQQHK